MAGANTNRFLVVGESGSGKTVLVNEIVQRYTAADAYNYLVIVSADAPEESDLAPHCEHVEELDDDLAQMMSEQDLIKFLRLKRSVYLELTATKPHEFLDRLSNALMHLGHALAVFDEAPEYLNRQAGAATLRLWTRGRKRGVHLVTVAHSVKQRDALGLNPVIINRTNTLISFLLSDPNEQAHVFKLFPRIKPYLGNLKTPQDGGVPEYALRQLGTGAESVKLRSGALRLQ